MLIHFAGNPTLLFVFLFLYPFLFISVYLFKRTSLLSSFPSLPPFSFLSSVYNLFLISLLSLSPLFLSSFLFLISLLYLPPLSSFSFIHYPSFSLPLHDFLLDDILMVKGYIRYGPLVVVSTYAKTSAWRSLFISRVPQRVKECLLLIIFLLQSPTSPLSLFYLFPLPVSFSYPYPCLVRFECLSPNCSHPIHLFL